MQTFLPHPDFRESMRALDPRRLGNQVYREGLTLLRGGWQNHPASKMWRGHRHALASYLLAGIHTLEERGYSYPHHEKEIYDVLFAERENTEMPHWLGNEAFHASHRSNLLRKDPVWYGELGWTEPHDLPYIWPTPRFAST